jgi:LVIVD repeat-containing protein
MTLLPRSRPGAALTCGAFTLTIAMLSAIGGADSSTASSNRPPARPVVVRALTASHPLADAASARAHAGGEAGQAAPQTPAAPQRPNRSAEDVTRLNSGCATCHKPDAPTMHKATTVRLACVDCHGGTPGVNVKEKAHVRPRLDIWKTAANPQQAGPASLEESIEFIRFVNPGDLRVAGQTCGLGGCHSSTTNAVRKSMMTHSAMLWGAALYNNGSYPFKNYQFGEAYMPDGTPATIRSSKVPTPDETKTKGILPFVQPLFRWEVSQPSNVLRIFERGGRKQIEIGIPDPEEEPGRPKNRFSNRGYGTLNRTDPVFIGLQKTRLFDPTLNMIGTNDQPGDYRGSGCTSCHVIYANDRSPVHAGPYAPAGNMGRSQTSDPKIPKDESGHPIKHELTRAIPTSQCIVCHMHPGTNVETTYLGYTWWDNESDADKMYPKEERSLSAEERDAIQRRNPEGSALKGEWSNLAFLEKTGTAEFNNTLSRTRFADFHGHGWLYRAVFKRDRKGNLLDVNNTIVANPTPQQLTDAINYLNLPTAGGAAPATPPATGAEAARAGMPVHLKDIHLERGMHCVDCHFSQDNHGNGNLYGETRNSVEIACIDCHGTISARATLKTSGPAAPEGGTDLTGATFSTPFGDPQFSRRGPRLTQRSMVTEGVSWEIPQVIDTITPGNPRYSERSRLAKTIQKDGRTWGGPAAEDRLAHADSRMTCYSCHSSWMTSCFGCHLAQTANQKKPMLHYEGLTTKNWTSYNFQVLRDDVFMLGKDGTVTGNRIAPVRSSSAVVVSSQDLNRQWVYFQQQTISAEGYAGQAFNTHVPHTVRGKETKYCTDCHVSANGDNNAVLAQLLLQGTNFVNFFGRFVYVGTGRGGLEAVAVGERDEPQAVIGSDLHKYAYPREYEEFVKNGRRLTEADHHGSSNALSVQQRGEYVYIADGSGGFRVFDIAQLNQKGFSEKIVTAPVSPFGQDTSVKTKYATAVASPTTLGVDPVRVRKPENEEQPIHPMYAYIYITDREEGLVLSTAFTLLDGNPSNNFLKRAATFNPDGILKGAVNLTLAGHYAYILCDRGLVIVDLDDPLKPKVVGEVGAPSIRQPKAVAVQFRYAFVTDADGLKVVDITFPDKPRFVAGAAVPIREAQGIYVARTYAYVAAGSQGLVIVDVERPEQPKIDQTFNASGALNDSRDVKIGMTNASVFAYVADGKNGLQVLQLMSSNGPGNGSFGFSPRPSPQLIATYKTDEPALSISKGLDRDRAVDETGHQVAVFGRRGARPFNLDEMRRMYVRNGQVWTVNDQPPGPPTGGGTDETAPREPVTPPKAQIQRRR